VTAGSGFANPPPASEPKFAIPTKIDGGPMHMFERLIYVPIRRVAPTAGPSIIFLAPKIGPSASQQLHSLAKTAPAIEVHIRARVIVEILSVNYGGTVDFADGSFHFAIGLHQVARDIGLLPNAQQELSRAQIAAGAQIRGMAAGRVGIDGRGRESGGQSDQA